MLSPLGHTPPHLPAHQMPAGSASTLAAARPQPADIAFEQRLIAERRAAEVRSRASEDLDGVLDVVDAKLEAAAGMLRDAADAAADGDDAAAQELAGDAADTVADAAQRLGLGADASAEAVVADTSAASQLVDDVRAVDAAEGWLSWIDDVDTEGIAVGEAEDLADEIGAALARVRVDAGDGPRGLDELVDVDVVDAGTGPDGDPVADVALSLSDDGEAFAADAGAAAVLRVDADAAAPIGGVDGADGLIAAAADASEDAGRWVGWVGDAATSARPAGEAEDLADEIDAALARVRVDAGDGPRGLDELVDVDVVDAGTGPDGDPVADVVLSLSDDGQETVDAAAASPGGLAVVEADESARSTGDGAAARVWAALADDAGVAASSLRPDDPGDAAALSAAGDVVAELRGRVGAAANRLERGAAVDELTGAAAAEVLDRRAAARAADAALASRADGLAQLRADVAAWAHARHEAATLGVLVDQTL